MDVPGLATVTVLPHVLVSRVCPLEGSSTDSTTAAEAEAAPPGKATVTTPAAHDTMPLAMPPGVQVMQQ